MRRCRVTGFAAIVVLSLSVSAVEVRLTNGVLYSGDIAVDRDTYLVLDVEGSRITIYKSLIDKIDGKPYGGPRSADSAVGAPAPAAATSSSAATPTATASGPARATSSSSVEGSSGSLEVIEDADTSAAGGTSTVVRKEETGVIESSAPPKPESDALRTEEIVEESPVPPVRGDNASLADPLSMIRKNSGKSIAGCIVFCVAEGVDWGLLYPWGLRISRRTEDLQRRKDAYDNNPYNPYATVAEQDAIQREETSLLGESMGLLLAGIPVGTAKNLGASIACAGASRVYGSYKVGVDPGIRDIQVWKPYLIGWIFGACSQVLGMVSTVWTIAGDQPPPQIGYVSTGLNIGRDVAWTTASIWSMAYSIDRRSAVRRRVSLGFCGANGLALRVRF